MKIIAHRGASHDAPENTLAAFRLAWQRGADGVEGDFRLTGDGQVVCIHDNTTRRTAEVDLPVADCPLAKLRKLDVGVWKAGRWVGERIPTLAEILALVPPGAGAPDDKRILIEVKTGPEILPILAPILAESGLRREQIAILAFDREVIARAKQLLPDVAAYWLVEHRMDPATGAASPTAGEILATLGEIRADGVDCSAALYAVDEDFLAAFRNDGREVHVWTVDNVPSALVFQSLGVDSLTTNRPGFLRRHLSDPGPLRADTARPG